MGASPAHLPQIPGSPHWNTGAPSLGLTCHPPPPLTRGAPADSTSVASLPFPASASFQGFSYLCYRLAPFSNSLKILCLGWEGERRGQSHSREGENIPGWRKGQGLPATSIQQSPQQNLSGSEGKVQRPGRARPRAGAAGSASHPYSAEAGDTFHHLLSEKQ